MMLFLGLIATCLSLETIPLDFPSSQPDHQFKAIHFAMGDNGTIMISRRHALDLFSSQGEWQGSYETEPNRWVANFAYLPEQGVIAVCTLGKTPSSSALTGRLVFLNEEAQVLGIGLNPYQKDPEDVYFRQIIPVGSRLFVHSQTLNEKFGNYIQKLQEITLVYADKGFEIVYNGDPIFRRLVTLDSVTGTFHRQWLTAEPGSDRLFLADETRYGLTVMEPRATGGMKRSGQHPLALNHMVEPFLLEDPSLRGKDRQERTQRYLHAFTHISGMSTSEGGLIIAYESPRTNHPWYADRFGEKAEFDGPAFHLFVEWLDFSARPKRLLAKLGNAHFIGIHETRLFTFHQEPGHEDRLARYWMEVRDLTEPTNYKD